MQDGVKSTLVVGNSNKNIEKNHQEIREIDYKQVNNINDYIGELSD